MKTFEVTIQNPVKTTQVTEVEALHERAAIAKVLSNYVLNYSVLETPIVLHIDCKLAI